MDVLTPDLQLSLRFLLSVRIKVAKKFQRRSVTETWTPLDLRRSEGGPVVSGFVLMLDWIQHLVLVASAVSERCVMEGGTWFEPQSVYWFLISDQKDRKRGNQGLITRRHMR